MIANAQYAEFLNAKAATDANALYNTNMGSGFGGNTPSCGLLEIEPFFMLALMRRRRRKPAITGGRERW